MQYGATVLAMIYPQSIGLCLHLLEYAPEVFLIEREACNDGELWHLRSDEFPATWDRCAVLLIAGLKNERPEIELAR